MYRDSFIRCPNCQVALPKRQTPRCEHCYGAWISELSLKDRMLAVRVDNSLQVELNLHDTGRTPRYGCPVCNKVLKVMSIGVVEVDCCPSGHGIWFDAFELAAVLEAASLKKETTTPLPPDKASVQQGPQREAVSQQPLSHEAMRQLTKDLTPSLAELLRDAFSDSRD